MALYAVSATAFKAAGFLALPKTQSITGSSWRRKHSIVSASIGFSTDPRIQIEKAAGNLLKDVAALLVYQEVFRSPPAQAFLKLLLVLRRRDDDLKIFEAYGEFVRLMASGRHPSWEDFLLEGIVKAEGNAFAEAAAGIGNPSSSYGGEVPASLEAAAVSDLEALQRLSVNEATLAGWVTELVSETKPEWRSAAASSLSCRTVPKIVSSKEQKPSMLGFDLGDTETKEDENGSPETSQTEVIEKHFINKDTDFVTSEREQWQKKVGGLWKWSEAVPLLKQYYTQHGFGRVSTYQALKWKAGKLSPDFKYLKSFPGANLTILTTRQSELQDNIKGFAERSLPPRHVLLHGPSGSGKSWLLRSALCSASKEVRFRLLLLPSSDVKQLATLLEDLRKNFSVSFILVVEDLFLRAAEDSYHMLKSILDEHMEDWPENVLFCATSSRTEARVGDTTVKLADLFRLPIELRELDEKEYLTCVEEILEHKSHTLMVDSTRDRDELQKQALAWGQSDKLVVKRAARFVENILVTDKSIRMVFSWL